MTATPAISPTALSLDFFRQDLAEDMCAKSARADQLDGILQAMVLTAQGMVSERCGSPVLSYGETVTGRSMITKIVTIIISGRQITALKLNK
jgi:hypothetical protein